MAHGVYCTADRRDTAIKAASCERVISASRRLATGAKHHHKICT